MTSSFKLVPRPALLANPWNPNRMTAAMYAKALESIKLYGFIDPLTVRAWSLDGSTVTYQIIDGEHRYRAGCDLGMTEFPCTVLEGLTDADAKKLTIVLNELHGQADPARMGDLLNEILQLTSLDDLMVAMPYDEKVLASYLQTPLKPLPPLKPTPQAASGAAEPEVWAERLFRLPKTVALVIDEAIEKAKDGEEIETWQALERVAADYLAS